MVGLPGFEFCEPVHEVRLGLLPTACWRTCIALGNADRRPFVPLDERRQVGARITLARCEVSIFLVQEMNDPNHWLIKESTTQQAHGCHAGLG